MMERRKNLNDKFGFVEIMEYTSIGESCSVVSGGTPSRSKNEYWENGNIPWIKIGNIKSKYVNEYDELITEQGLNNSSAKLLKKGTILYTIFATLGEVGILDIEACTNQAIAGINITDPRITTDYLYYYLKSKKDYVNNIGRGVAQNNINLTTLKNFEIPLIDVDKQLNIVEILEKVERMICLKEKEIDDLDLLIKARFIEMFGDVRENSNEFEIVQFNDIVEYMGDIGSNGANKVVVNHLDMKDEEDYAIMVRFTNFTKNDFKNDVKYVSKDAYDFFKKSQIFGGELIVCKIGSAGQNYVMPYLNRPVSLGLNQIMIRIKDTILMPYLYQYLHTDYGEFLISGCINGAVTKTITKTELKKIPILLPPMEFQQRFAEFVQQVDKSREEVEKSLEKTQQLYDSLMQEYFG